MSTKTKTCEGKTIHCAYSLKPTPKTSTQCCMKIGLLPNYLLDSFSSCFRTFSSLWLAFNSSDCISSKCLQIKLMFWLLCHIANRNVLINWIIYFSYYFSPQTQLGNQNSTTNELEVNASQTHRLTTSEAPSLFLSSLISFDEVTSLPDRSSSPVLSTLISPVDLGLSPLDRLSPFSDCFYELPLLSPESLIQGTGTGPLITDSSQRSQLSSHSSSTSSLVIPDELLISQSDSNDHS